ncbi:MAG: hypothetical protein IKG51_05475 [Firmicutes bacterium]|nr:hypothetical protein [Bacillota bacterium]
MRYVLGIDQGATKTHALVADEAGHLLGLGTGIGACHSMNGMAAAMRGVEESVRAALSMAELSLIDIGWLAAGMTGVDWSDEAGLLTDALEKTLGIGESHIHVVNDCIIALRAGTNSPMGCILCAGTGLNCGVRDGKGQEYVYGYYIPDEDQGGNALARRALQAVFNAESGMGAATSLTGRFLALTHCENVDDLLRKKVENRLTQAEKHEIPIIVSEEVLSGDPVAARVLTQFGKDIAAYAVSGIRRLVLQNEPIEVIISGSVFKCKAPILLDTVKEVILTAVPNARIIESAMEPVVGAVLLALDDLENTDPVLIQKNLEQDAPKLHMLRKKN